MKKPDYYTTEQIAVECGVSIWLVARYLRENFPNHEWKSWWRFSEADFLAICKTLKEAKAARPKQPLRALRNPILHKI